MNYVERESLLLLPFQVLGHHPVPADGRAQGLPVHGRAGPQGQVWGQPRKVEGHVVAVEHADRRDGSPYVRHIWLIFQSCNFHLSFWAKFWWNIPFSVNFSQFNDKLQRQKINVNQIGNSYKSVDCVLGIQTLDHRRKRMEGGDESTAVIIT